jgi:hypothetical protein
VSLQEITGRRLRYANAVSLDKEPAVAVELLRELSTIDLELRREEVAILTARNLGALGRRDEAMTLLEAELERDPLLLTNYDFMWTYRYQRYPLAKKNPVTQWRANRMNDVENPERFIEE